jgi:hypothetical protein
MKHTIELLLVRLLSDVASAQGDALFQEKNLIEVISISKEALRANY